MFKKLLPTLGLAVLGLLAVQPAAQAQTGDGPRRCDFDQKQLEYFNAHPGAEREYDDFLRSVATNLANMSTAERNQLNAAPDVTIPIVIHVLFTTPANNTPAPSNITDRQITDAFAVINEDFRKANADTADIIPLFQPLIANVGFQFRLAKLDPNGNCTTGITRSYSVESNYGTNNVVNGMYWDPSKYLNVWIVDDIASGAGGYTFGNLCGGPTGDGIVLRNTQFGNSGRSCSANLCHRSLTHEIGHYFGLPHTWGRTNTPGLASNCSIDDNIADTPNTAGYSQAGNGACNTNYGVCTDAAGQRIISNVQNFMDYADCEKMFTLGQRAVMRATIVNLPCRVNLVSPANLVATGTNDGFVANPCSPIARFVPTTTTVCVGSPVSVRDYSYNYSASGGALTYSWSFPGGTPATATGSTASVSYATPGFYTIIETVTNSVGSDISTRTDLIRVEGPSSGIGAPAVESFESTTFPLNQPAPSLANWESFGTSSTGYPSSARWVRQAALPAADGAGYLVVNNSFLAGGSISTLISPNINLSQVPQPASLRFSRVYALRPGATGNDELRISFSSDCGNTWGNQTIINATALSTVPATSGHSPSVASDWQDMTVAIPAAYQGRSQFKVRFQMVNGTTAGNNFYMDYLRIAGPLATHEAALAQRGISVYPNPLTNETAVHLDLSASTQVQLRLTDVLGREVLTLPAKTYGAGKQAISLQTAGRPLQAGIYVVRIALNGETFSSKLTVQ
jgi:PKD repeat protein